MIAVVLFCLPVAAQSFWTRERKADTVIYAGVIAVDSWTANRTNDAELNPLARPFVNHGIYRQTAGAALGFAAGIGPSYLLHRTGHETLSRWWLRTFTAVESVNTGRQLYRLH